jgi:hypothetical protein
MSESARTVLEYARDLLEFPMAATTALWPRASAFLARQALETSLDEFWTSRAPGLEACSAKAQLLCAREYLPESLAHSAYETWALLSRACHHHPYELAPTAAELRGWIEAVDAIDEAVRVETSARNFVPKA